ncbi:MAG TPA: phosphotransferase [Longimicrobium sp.]|jgi:hypothetical protein
MILTKSNLVHFLLDRRLIAAEAVVAGDFAAREVLRHNRSFAVERQRERGLFIKQPILWDELSVACIQREAACYQLAQAPGWEGLRALIPALVDSDAASSTLVLELLRVVEPLQDHHARFRRFPVGTARALGSALAAYHRVPVEAGAAALEIGVAWVLRRTFPPGYVEGEPRLGWLLARIRETPGFEAALDALAAEWRNDALIHGDMKWENCIARGGDGGEQAPELRIVDWEMAGVGDSAWDVGSALHSYLACWVLGLPLAAAASPRALTDANEYPAEAMHPALRAFWRAYREGRGGVELGFLLRAVRYAGARLVQTTWEYSRTQAAVPGYTHLLLQLGANVLIRPEQAARSLLGLEGGA